MAAIEESEELEEKAETEDEQEEEVEVDDTFLENDFEILASAVTGLCITTMIRLSECDDRDPFRARIAIHCLFYVNALLATVHRAHVALTGAEDGSRGGSESDNVEEKEQKTSRRSEAVVWARMRYNLPAYLRRLTTNFSPVAAQEEAEKKDWEKRAKELGKEEKEKEKVPRSKALEESRSAMQRFSKRMRESVERRKAAPEKKPNFSFSLSNVPVKEIQERQRRATLQREKELKEQEERERKARLKEMQRQMQLANERRLQARAHRRMQRQRGLVRRTKVFGAFVNEPTRMQRARNIYEGIKDSLKDQDHQGEYVKRPFAERLALMTGYLVMLQRRLSKIVNARYVERHSPLLTLTVDQRVDEFMGGGHSASENLAEIVGQFEKLLDYIHAWEEFHKKYPMRRLDDLNGYVLFLEVFLDMDRFHQYDPEAAGLIQFDGEWNMDEEMDFEGKE